MKKKNIRRQPLEAWTIVTAGNEYRQPAPIHTNWLLGLGVEAWPGMSRFGLFSTRKAAREAYNKIKRQVPQSSKLWKICRVRLLIVE